MSTLSQFMHGGAPRYYEEITVSKTWTKPAGITTFFVEVFGGSGKDGAGKVRARLYESSDLSDSVVITIGAAGTAYLYYSRYSSPPLGYGGSGGGNTSFGSLSSSLGARLGVGAFLNSATQTTDVANLESFESGFVRITGW